MNEKFKTLMASKVKDFGLSSKVIDELTEQFGKDIDDNTTDEDINKQADFAASIAKMMQGEVTRKVQARQKPSPEPQNIQQQTGEGDNGVPSWFLDYQKKNDERVGALVAENNAFKAKEAAAARAALISVKAKEKGIPEYLSARLNIGETDNVDEYLDAFKQELVNNSLLPKGSADGAVIKTDDITQAVKNYVSGLADK